MDTVASLPTLDDLRRHVHQALCAHDQLDPGQAPLFEGMVVRRGRPCGLFFHVQGPRLLKSYALWAGEENRILFYNSGGERYAELRLAECPIRSSWPHEGMS